MKNERTVLGRLEIIKRLPSCENGNPRFLLRIGGVEVRTTPDANLAYGITNYDGVLVRAVIADHYGKPSIINVERSFDEALNI